MKISDGKKRINKKNNLEINDNFNFEDFKMIVNIPNKQNCWILHYY